MLQNCTGNKNHVKTPVLPMNMPKKGPMAVASVTPNNNIQGLRRVFPWE